MAFELPIPDPRSRAQAIQRQTELLTNLILSQPTQSDIRAQGLKSLSEAIPSTLLAALQIRKQNQANAARSLAGGLIGKESRTPEEESSLNKSLLELGILPPQLKVGGRQTPEQAEKVAEARARGAAKGKGQGLESLGPEDHEALGRALAEGRLAPKQLTYRGPKAKILASELRKDPNFNAKSLDVEFGAEQQRARTLNSQQTTSELASINQFKDAGKQLLEAARQIPRTSFVPLNRLTQKTLTQFFASGSPEFKAASKLLALQSEIGLQASRVFSGSSPTDIRFRAEQERLPVAGSIEQLEEVMNTLINLAETRREFITEAPTLLPKGARPTSQRTQAPPAQQHASESGQIVVNPKTGVRMRWNGKQWQVVR